MSLDVTLTAVRPTIVYDSTITHNLSATAKEAGVYMLCWRPEKIGITKAAQLIVPLRDGIALMKAAPERFKKFNHPCGWGTYQELLSWLERYLKACEENTEADVRVSR